MNILVSSNDKYLKPLITALYSLSLNTNEKEINVYFINVSVEKKKINWLKNRLERIDKIRFNCININSDILSSLKVNYHFSIEAYSRLLVLKVLPKNIDRILWLDADIIIHNNIDDLYNYNVDGKSIVVCKSIAQIDAEKRKKLSLDDNQLYFNSGIILFNLEYLRKNIDADLLINYAINNNSILEWLDQDVLNATLGKTAEIIDYKKYNYMHFSGTVIDDDEKKYIESSNCILHYIGAIKPWHFKFDCSTYKYWKKYAKKSCSYSEFYFCKQFLLHKVYMTLYKIRKNRWK